MSSWVSASDWRASGNYNPRRASLSRATPTVVAPPAAAPSPAPSRKPKKASRRKKMAAAWPGACATTSSGTTDGTDEEVMAAQYRADALDHARELAEEERARARFQRFMED